jgi:hypothetical protein
LHLQPIHASLKGKHGLTNYTARNKKPEAIFLTLLEPWQKKSSSKPTATLIIAQTKKQGIE